MNTRMWFVAVVLACFAGPVGNHALGQDRSVEARLEAKIAELEKRLQELEGVSKNTKQEDKRPTLLPAVPPSSGGGEAVLGQPPPVGAEMVGGAAPSPTSGGSGLSAAAFGGFKDGFVFNSADGLHHLRFTGQIQADGRIYPRLGDFTDIDTFLLRRARLGIEANLFNHYEFRLLPDFGNGSTIIQDAYMNVHHWDALQFEVGKFKQPVSYEQLIQDRFVPTLERSLVDQLIPARDLGMMIHGQKLLGDHRRDIEVHRSIE